jgi:hypothetical protein
MAYASIRDLDKRSITRLAEPGVVLREQASLPMICVATCGRQRIRAERLGFAQNVSALRKIE